MIETNILIKAIVSQCWFTNNRGYAYIDYDSNRVYSTSENGIEVSSFNEILDDFLEFKYAEYTEGVVREISSNSK